MDFENFTRVLQVFKVTVIDIEIISFLTLIDHALTIYLLLYMAETADFLHLLHAEIGNTNMKNLTLSLQPV